MLVDKKKTNYLLQVSFIFLISILFFHQSYSQTVQTINSSGNFTIPQGVIEITVECWGAGGGGGGNSGSDRPGGGEIGRASCRERV